MTAFCVDCGARFAPDDRFCTGCGAARDQTDLAVSAPDRPTPDSVVVAPAGAWRASEEDSARFPAADSDPDPVEAGRETGSARVRFTKPRVIALIVVGVAAVAVFGVILARAELWGAIAVSPTGRGNNTGFSYDYLSPASASTSAIARCGADDCQTVVVVKGGCAAVAQASGGALGWAAAASSGDVESQAIASSGGGAHIVTWTCTFGHS